MFCKLDLFNTERPVSLFKKTNQLLLVGCCVRKEEEIVLVSGGRENKVVETDTFLEDFRIFAENLTR